MQNDPVALTKERGLQNLKDLLRMLEFEASVECLVEDDQVLLHIESPDSARLIGHDAQMLNALQLLLNRMTPREFGQAPHITVDVERYRERRKDRLLGDALGAAERVEATGRPVRLPPLSAADRRVVHQALKARETLTTFSGPPDRDGRKRVTIALRHDLEPEEDESVQTAAPEEPEPTED